MPTKTSDDEVSEWALASQIVSNPVLRAEFFEDPEEMVARLVSQRTGMARRRTQDMQEGVFEALAKMVQAEPALASMVNAETVLRQLRGSIRNPELAFRVILGLSIGAFLTGAALIVAGITAAIVAEEPAILAAILGGGGVAGVFGSLYAITRTGVSMANANHAQLRIILHGFAMAVGHLQALPLNGLEDVEKVNDRIRDAAEHAVRLILTGIKEKGNRQPEGVEERSE